MDRIDLHVEVPTVDYKELSGEATGETSEEIRGRVEAAREVQRGRFASADGVRTNSEMTPQLMEESCLIGSAASGLLEQAMDDLNFSARAHDRILKVARTLADLAGKADIGEEEVLEAVQYRTLDRDLWA